MFMIFCDVSTIPYKIFIPYETFRGVVLRTPSSNREWRSGLGYIDSTPILVVSTGVGGPSISICIDELAQLGIRTFIRAGTTGAIQENINVGDLVISTGAVRLDGASKDFAPLEYPAVANIDVTNALIASAVDHGIKPHVGITVSTDTFYQAQERYSGYSSFLIERHVNSIEQWRRLNALNFEMESGTLLTMCSAFGLEAGCVAGVIVSRAEQESIDLSVINDVQNSVAKVAIGAAKILCGRSISG